MTDCMVHSLFQPSLPSTDDDKSPRCGTGAFFLQPFGQSRIVIGLGAYGLARIESGLPSRIGRDGQVALSYIHPNDLFVRLRSGVSYLNLKGNKQVKLLAGLVIPELSGSDMGLLLEQSHMRALAGVGHDHTALQGENAHLGIFLQAIVPMEVVGECGRHVLRWLIQPAYLLIAIPLQGTSTAHLAMLERMARDVVQGIPIGQLCLAQGPELLRTGMQFQLSGQELFHPSSIAD